MFDTHVNLHASAFDADRTDVLARARLAGVNRFLAICSRWCDLDAVKALTAAHSDVFGTAGAHPHHAKDEPDIAVDTIVERSGYDRCVAIGETGLDLHYNHSPIDHQVSSFRAHIRAARMLDLPVIVHTRKADDLTQSVLAEELADGDFRFVLHCYSSGRALAEWGAAQGAYFSVNGIMSFKNAQDVRDIVVDIMPADRVFLETDAPYLAPIPHRGRRNEPAFLPHIVETLAALRGWTVEDTMARTTANALALFDRVSKTDSQSVAAPGIPPGASPNRKSGSTSGSTSGTPSTSGDEVAR